MKNKLRQIFWRILGIDYSQALRVHDYIFLKKDNFTSKGVGTYDNGALVFRWTDAELTIGNYCSIANNVHFIVDEGFHGASSITSYPLVNNLFKKENNLRSGKDKNKFLKQIQQKKGITIGNDVWLGMGAIIMPGVTIGNGATIAANSVVTKNIPDYVVAAGVPAKIIKKKFDDADINELNKISWWDWDIEIIKDRIEQFYNNPEDFINNNKTD